MVSVAANPAPVELMSKPEVRYHAYPIRWAIVLILALINGSNAYLWISFAPVADHFVDFYSTNEILLNWTQLIFPITTVLLGLPASLLVDWFGVRFVILSSATANLICGLFRVMSSVSTVWPSLRGRLALIVLGQLIASFGQPLCMFTPAKLALDWFPDKQRTVANTIGSLGNTFGVLMGSAIAPLFVKHASDIPMFNYFSLGVVSFGFILSCLVVRKGKPKLPPSAAAAVLELMHKRQAQLTELRAVLERFRKFMSQCIEPFRSAGFCLLMLAFGCGLAYFTTLSTLFEQILCTKGYSNQFAGLCGSLMIATGTVASVFSAIFADRTGMLIESVQVCYVVAILGALGFSITLWYPNQQPSILFCVSWLGAWGFAQYSLALELAAEATFPVPEAITSGLLIVVSQILSIIFISFMQALAPRASPNAEFTPACGPAATPLDYGVPNMAICGVLVVIAIVQLFCLRLSYKRRTASAAHTSALDLNPNVVITVESSENEQEDVAYASMETVASA